VHYNTNTDDAMTGEADNSILLRMKKSVIYCTVALSVAVGLFLVDIYGEYELRHWMAAVSAPIMFFAGIGIMPNYRLAIDEKGLSVRQTFAVIGRRLFEISSYTIAWSDVIEVRESVMPGTFVIDARCVAGTRSIALNSFLTNSDQAMCFLTDQVPDSRMTDDVLRYVGRRCNSAA
jgi:hypothetical protein